MRHAYRQLVYIVAHEQQHRLVDRAVGVPLERSVNSELDASDVSVRHKAESRK